jgi:hypothetical protein
VQAQASLGFLYETDQGVKGGPPKNYEKAFKWLLKAAESNHRKAQKAVGLLYAEGAGTRRDYVRAYKWLTLRGSSSTALKTIEKDMAAGDILKAQRLVREWKASRKKN